MKKPDTTVGLFVAADPGLAQMLLILDDRVVQGLQQRFAHFQFGVLVRGHVDLLQLTSRRQLSRPAQLVSRFLL